MTDPEPPVPPVELGSPLDRIESVEEEPPLEGCYLRLRRFRLRNHHVDGKTSPVYPCDVIERPGTDAVGVIAWANDAGGRTWVLVREGIRPPVWARREADVADAAAEDPGRVAEVVAGGLEDGDAGPEGIRRRAAAELREETGYEVDPADVTILGGAYYPTPGVYTEKVHLAACRIPDPAERREPSLDGPMERGARLTFVELAEAIRRCREGTIPDAKAEIGFRRLADHLGHRGP